MSKYNTKCVVCGKPYSSSHENYRPWCSVGCKFSTDFNVKDCYDKARRQAFLEAAEMALQDKGKFATDNACVKFSLELRKKAEEVSK